MRLWPGERGAGLVMVLAFMALAVPLVTGALGLASTLSIDSRLKTRALKSQYTAIGGNQHATYRIAYEEGYASSLQTGVPNTYSITLNGEAITIGISKESNPATNIPPPAADNSRRLQTLKVVDPTTGPANFLTTFTYTITAANRDDEPENLRKLHDELPPGFTYVSGSTSGVTTDNPSISGRELTWNLAPLAITLQPLESVVLSFQAQATVADGVYCNEAWAEPGNLGTSSGKTALVTVGSPASTLCQGAVVSLTKTVSPPAAAAGVLQTYDYTVTLESLGTDALNMSMLRDLLPVGFSYVPGSTSGSITSQDPTTTLFQGQQRLDWFFSPDFQIQSAAVHTLTFQVQATAEAGEYWNEAWATLDEFEVPYYSWPTARIEVMGVVSTEASNGEHTTSSEVWLAPGSYYVVRWDIGP